MPRKSTKTTAKTTAPEGPSLRPLVPDDLEAVVAIDRQLSGQSRRDFYERRLKAALRHPKAFIYLGATDGKELTGFVLARLLGGEFGAAAKVAALDAIGVAAGRHGRGTGRALMAGLEELLRKKGVSELHSQADWTNHSLLRFFDAAGFERAPRQVLERPTAQDMGR